MSTANANGTPPTPPQPAPTHPFGSTKLADTDKGEPFGDILTDAFGEVAKFFTNLEPEASDEAMVRSVVTAARATVKRVESGAVAVSSPAVLRKLRATAKAMKRTLEDMIDEDVDDTEVDADPSGKGDPSVAKKKGKAGRRA